MKHTEVISYLINTLKEANLITYNKDLLSFIGIPINSIYIKRLSGYINRCGEIRDRYFLNAIEKRFDLQRDIWQIGESTQKQRIKEAIQKELLLRQLPGEEALDISNIIHSSTPITQEQINYLDTFFILNREKGERKMINHFFQIGLLDKKVENQEFLLKLLKLSYKKGLYDIIISFILPNLYRKYRLFTKVQKIEANSLGSLGKYEEAKQILHILIDKDFIESINLRTSALSNHKRELLQERPIDRDKLYTLIMGYQKLHSARGIYSYYAGINLLYVAKLAQMLFPLDNRFTQIDLKTIYEHSKHSLKKDKTHHKYYKTMNKYEFKLLLEAEGVCEKIESFLDNERPHHALVERSLRQMQLFYDALPHTHNVFMKSFEKSIEILREYCKIF
ncbi:MAG: hypothetical protein JXQ68_04805 [Campylobacterales bacterium]|nr:hypothetical protein [Campylobacterales bacterium]